MDTQGPDISIHQHIDTTLMAKGKRVLTYLTRPVATQGPDISIHQHIDTTLMAKKEKGTGIPHKTSGHVRPKQTAGRDPQPANTSK